ncbi:MAG: hypothetical protein IJI14_08240 [Anaerolineaceae bacterium]|nr:hypothetical protein [Anaerolineaceae bacterium]
MKQIVKIILSLAAVALSLFLGMNAEKLFVKNLDLVTIPVPNQEIEPYTVLSEDMFTTREFTGYIKDFDYAESYSSLDGRLTTASLAQGLPVPMAFISQSTGYYMDDPKLEVVSIPLDPGRMVGGNVFPGQYINLYIQQNQSQEAKPVVFDDNNFVQENLDDVSGLKKIANLKVTAILDGNGNDIYASDSKVTGKTSAAIIVLAVRPDQTKTIVEAAAAAENKDSGTIIWATIANTK